MNFGDLLQFSQELLSIIGDFSRNIIDFVKSDINFFGNDVPLVYVLFGGGLVVFLGIKIALNFFD